MEGMSDAKSNLFSAVFTEYLPSLKHPWLFFMLLVLFLADLAIPDFIPFIDEAMFGLLTVLVGAWRDRRAQPQPPQTPKDVTDRGSDGPA